MKNLLSYAQALLQLFRHFHWRSSGPNYYGDHLLYDRIYNDIADEVDKIAEKTIGIENDSDAIGPESDTKMTAELVSKFTSDGDKPSEFPEQGIVAQKGFLKLISELMTGNPSDGVQNLLQGIADKHEEHLYLLQQRVRKNASVFARLSKIAGELDKKGHYALADQCDQIIKTALTHSHITKALKEDDHEAALNALSTFVSRIPYGSTPGQELGLTDDEFRSFALAIRKGNLDEARRIFGVTKAPDTTGKDTKLRQMLKDMYTFIKSRAGLLDFIRERGNNIVTIDFLPYESEDIKGFKSLFKNTTIHDEQIGRVEVSSSTYYSDPGIPTIDVWVRSDDPSLSPSLFDRVKDIFEN